VCNTRNLTSMMIDQSAVMFISFVARKMSFSIPPVEAIVD
jgi:hypothetical protein